MKNPFFIDVDATRTPAQINDALVNAQQKRVLKTINEESANDYGYSD